MAFKTSGIDFAKRLWEQHRIKYGPKDSYSVYPRRYKLIGMRASGDEQPHMVELEFSLKKSDSDYIIVIEEGGVTGYEDFGVSTIMRKDPTNPDRMDRMYLCAGGMGWDSLYVSLVQYQNMIRQMLKDKGVTL